MKILIADDIQGWVDYHSAIVSKMFPDADIITVNSAKEGYDKLMEYNDNPFDIIITDMQMEEDFEPKYAGEWFIEQIQTFKNYSKTKIVIVSATYNISSIAANYQVDYIKKQTARNFPEAYEILKEAY